MWASLISPATDALTMVPAARRTCGFCGSEHGVTNS